MPEINTMALLAIALFNMITAFLAFRTHNLSIATNIAVQRTQADVAIVEKATNSMKDALVAATGVAAHGQGLLEGRAEKKEEIAILTERLKDADAPKT